MKRIINFSGGKTSALMTILCYRGSDDLVLFCDTGREHPKTHKFLNDFEAFEKIPIVRIGYPGGFSQMIKEKTKNYLPNRRARFCTKHLKVVQHRKYCVSMGIKECENMIGFRHDEQRRIKKYISWYVNYHPSFPLNEMLIDKQQVNEYWSKKPYTLEIPHILGNCDLCFLKGKNAIISILVSHPELADKWIADEELKGGGTYLKGITYKEMLAIASNNLFKDYDLSEINSAYTCSCTT